MGLTILYSGRIRKMKQIKELTTETADICNSMNWEYNIIDKVMNVPAICVPKEPGKTDPKPIHLQGVVFTPPKCETISLIFTQSGRLTTFVNLMTAPEYIKHGLDVDLIYSIPVKTQFAGPEIHIALIKLLKYLEKKYLIEMEVIDEGYYWKTMDKAILLRRFNEYEILLDTVTNVLKNIKTNPNASTESLGNQIEKILRDKLDIKEKKRFDNDDIDNMPDKRINDES